MNTQYNILYYLAAIGEPNIDVKVDILKHNLCCVYYNMQYSFDIMINFYDDASDNLECMLRSLSFLKSIIIHKKKGRLVELWKSNPYHCLIDKYDYILYILDDVMITKWNMHEMIHIKTKHKIEFLSPRVNGGTWDYMRNQNSNILAFANKVELFCLILNSKDFHKFMNIHDVENKHTWGVDILLGHFDIRSAIYYKFVVTHMLPSTTNGQTAAEEMQMYLSKHGFVDVFEVHKKYQAIRNIIEITDDSVVEETM